MKWNLVNISGKKIEKKNHTKKIYKSPKKDLKKKKGRRKKKGSETQQKSNFGSQFQCSRAKDFVVDSKAMDD